jgi:hypothetical protein
MSRPLKSFIIWNFTLLIVLATLIHQAKFWTFLPSYFSFFSLFLATLIPMIVAYLVAKKYYGIRGVEKLISTIQLTEIQSTAMSISVSPIVFTLIGLGCYPLFFENYFSLTQVLKGHSLDSSLSVLAWFIPFIPLAISDAIGWRGFALPHLQSNYTAFSSSIVLGLINSLYILIILNLRQDFDLLFSLRLILSMIFQSFLLTTIFNFSKGNILPCILFNLISYFIIALDPDFLALVASIGYVLLSSFYINKYGRVHISDGHRIKNFYKKVLSSRSKRKILDMEDENEEAEEI